MRYIHLFYHAGRQWVSRDMSYYAAAFSYYAPLALVPLLLLSLIVTGFFYGGDFVKNIFLGWGTILGADLLALINVAVQNLDIEIQTYSIPLLAVIFFSSVSVFSFNVLGSGFQHLWGSHRSGLQQWLTQSLRSAFFVIILQLYFIFIIGTEGFLAWFRVREVPFLPEIIWFLSISLVFILIFKFLAKPAPSLRGCVFGGFSSGVLFIFANNLVALYLATKPVLSIFGAAGLLLVLLVWVYILACFILYGAALAHMYDRMINNQSSL